MGGVAIEDWGVPVADLAGVVQYDHLGGEVRYAAGRLVLRVVGNISSPEERRILRTVKLQDWVKNLT